MSGKLKIAVAAVFLTLTLADALIIQQTGSSPSARAAGEVQPAAAQVGKPAPNFKLTDSNGKEHSLADYKGKLVVLEWTNFDCPFVKKHYGAGNMQKLQNTYRKKGVVWLSINSSAVGRQGNYPPARINELIKLNKANPDAYLVDADGKVGHAYGATATPGMFVIDKEGILIYSGAIDDIPSADEVDIGKAKNYVASALDAAMAGKKVATSCTSAYGCSVKYQR